MSENATWTKTCLKNFVKSTEICKTTVCKLFSRVFFVKNDIYEQISRFFMHSNSGNHCTTKNSITLKAQCTNCTSFSLSSLFCKNAQICILQNIRYYYIFFPLYISECPSFQQLQNQYKINACMIFEPIHDVKLARKIWAIILLRISFRYNAIAT